jgi:hypothetical protein
MSNRDVCGVGAHHRHFAWVSLLAAVAAACSPPEPIASTPAPPAPKLDRSRPAATTLDPTAAPPPAVGTQSLPWPSFDLLPLSATQLPEGFRDLHVRRSEYDVRDLFRTVCGGVDPESALLEAIPEERVRDAARALHLGAVTSEVLRCRKAFSAAIGDEPRTMVSLSFANGQSSHESVVFVRLPVTELPKTAAFVHDAAPLVGLEQARCQYSAMQPRHACTDLGDAVARWSTERDGSSAWWVFGRVTGLQELVSARGGRKVHPRVADVASLLPCAGALPVTRVELRLPSTPLGPTVDMDRLHAADGPRRRECRRMPDVDSAERAVQAAAKAPAAEPGQRERHSCDDCAPSMRAAVVAEREARDARKPRETTTRREGTMVIEDSRWLDDPDYERAEAAVIAATEKRRALLAPILERWREGRIPSPKELGAINGPAYVAKLEEALREVR